MSINTHDHDNDFATASIPLRHLELPSRSSCSSFTERDRPTTQESLVKSTQHDKSHDATTKEKIEQTPIEKGGMESQTDWWIWELIGIFTSAVSLTAMIVVLYNFENKPSPQWPYEITINSILSWTSTIAKSAMFIPISSGLSQAKWIWFTKRERSLADMDYFEEASRGPYGSLFLLFRLRFLHLGTLGALITIVALAYEPAVQQIVDYRPRMVVDSNMTAWASASNYYGAYEPGEILSGKTASLDMKAATYSGVMSSVPSIPHYECQTGNCTWLAYRSLGVCSECHDVTPQMKVDCEGICEASLSDGATSFGNPNVMTSTTNFTPIYYKDIEKKAHVLRKVQGLASFGRPYPTEKSDISGTECVLHLCAKEYSSNVYDGHYNEMILQTWPNISSSAADSPPLISGPDDEDPGALFFNVDGVKYAMNHWSFSALQKHLDIIFEGHVEGKTQSYTYYGSQDVMQAIWSNASFSIPIASLATSMTTVIREYGGPTSKSGKVWKPAIYIKVRWWYLALPISLFVATLVQLGMTVLKTRRCGAGIWRSSSLALVFHGFDRDLEKVAASRLKGLGDGTENDEKLLKAAKGISVKMTRLDDGTIKLTSSNAFDERIW